MLETCEYLDTLLCRASPKKGCYRMKAGSTIPTNLVDMFINALKRSDYILICSFKFTYYNSLLIFMSKSLFAPQMIFSPARWWAN